MCSTNVSVWATIVDAVCCSHRDELTTSLHLFDPDRRRSSFSPRRTSGASSVSGNSDTLLHGRAGVKTSIALFLILWLRWNLTYYLSEGLKVTTSNSRLCSNIEFVTVFTTLGMYCPLSPTHHSPNSMNIKST